MKSHNGARRVNKTDGGKKKAKKQYHKKLRELDTPAKKKTKKKAVKKKAAPEKKEVPQYQGDFDWDDYYDGPDDPYWDDMEEEFDSW